MSVHVALVVDLTKASRRRALLQPVAVEVVEAAGGHVAEAVVQVGDE
jgi:hypothetical protein